MKKLIAIGLYLGAMVASFAAWPQSKQGGDPADPKAPVPMVRYVSSFKPYEPLGDAPVSSWRGANETVDKIGGWKAYARESEASGKPALPAVSVPPKPPAHPEHHPK